MAHDSAFAGMGFPMNRKQRRAMRLKRDRNAGGGAAARPSPYVLICRFDDDEGSGFDHFVGVAGPEEGDALAREMRQVAAPELPNARCDLVENTHRAINTWAGQSVARKQALARFGEDRR